MTGFNKKQISQRRGPGLLLFFSFLHDRKSFQWTCDNSVLDLPSPLHAAGVVVGGMNPGKDWLEV